MSISSTTITGLAYSPSTSVSNTLPGRAPFHWLDAPLSTQPAVSELIEMKPMPVPSNSAISRAKCVLPTPGGPSSRMGMISSASRLSWHSAIWRLTSSRASWKFGNSSYR